MAKKKKYAAKAAPETPTDSHVDEVDYEPAPSDEEESMGATPTTNAEATLPARKEPSPSHGSPSDSSSSSSSDAEEALRANIRGDFGKPMEPEELAMLLYTEATARIVALREGPVLSWVGTVGGLRGQRINGKYRRIRSVVCCDDC